MQLRPTAPSIYDLAKQRSSVQRQLVPLELTGEDDIFILNEETAPTSESEPKRRGAPTRIVAKSSKKSKTAHVVQCDIDSWDSEENKVAELSFKSTRDSVIRTDADRAGAELAGQPITVSKEKTGYQLFHMHRVAEIKRDLGVKHHDAFKRAAKDWTRLPESEKDWYNERADKKPLGRPVKIYGQEENNSLRVVGEAVSHMLFDVDVRSTSLPALAPPRMAVALPSEEMLSSEPAANEAYVWSCNICGFGDAGSPEGVCILCEALSKNQ